MISKILDVAFLLRAKLSGNQLDLALLAATNDENWQAAPALLHAISSAAYSHQKWQRISDFLWSRLRNSSRWKKVLKALNVVQFLLKNGPSFAVDDLRKEVVFFLAMESFVAEEDGMDRGASIRERARVVVGLLQNESLLEDERASAKLIRERMSQMAGTSSYNSEGGAKNVTAPKYQSISSKSLPKDGDAGFYNYGSGNYGDRQEEAAHQKHEQASRRMQHGERQIREVVPIVLLDIKQRKVEVNPLYQVVQKRMKEGNSQRKRSSSEMAIKRQTKEKVERPKPSKPAPVLEKPNISTVQQAKPIQAPKEMHSPQIQTEDSSAFLLQGIDITIPIKPTQPQPIEPPNKSTGLQLLYLNPFAPTAPPPQQEFTPFKNGGNFEIEKIAWLSTKQKSLTDLCDLEVVAVPATTQQKKEFTNNIKIDPWAW